jgi:predicted permease
VLAVALALCTVAGVLLQRSRVGARARTVVWWTSFIGLGPSLVVAAFLTTEIDRGLLLGVAAAIAGNWIVLGLAYLVAWRLASSREERGCLALAASFGNTGYMGVPLSLLAFGPAAVPAAVIYDRLGWLLPPTAVSTAIARTHGAAGDALGRRWHRAFLLNPPALALVAAIALRLSIGEVHAIASFRDAAAYLVGPTGFLLLGLSVPLDRIRLSRQEAAAGTVAVAIRVVAGPVVLLALDHALGADVPNAFYLSSALPGAFHLLVIARLYELRPILMRAMVVVSSAAAVIAVSIGSAIW